MSYSDAHQTRSAKPIIAVFALHGLIAYGFITGLAYQVIPFVDHPIVARDIPDDAPPPPKAMPVPEHRNVTRTQLTAPQSVAPLPSLGSSEIIEVPVLGPVVGEPTQTLPLAPPLPPKVSHARAATVIGQRATWVTTDDYPPSALREGVEGIVGIRLTIGADGKVAACAVTSSSGNALLDGQTCRTYTRRARFTPALDEAGQPTTATRDDRVRWQLPAQ